MIVTQIFGALAAINKQRGMAMLLAEPNARAALEIADCACIIENGRIVMHGAAAEMRANEDIREFYPGLSVGSEKKSFRDVKHYKRRKRWLG